MQALFAFLPLVGRADNVSIVHLQGHCPAAVETKSYARTAHRLVTGFTGQCLVAGNTSAVQECKCDTSRRCIRKSPAQVGCIELSVCGEALVVGNLTLL